MFPRTNASKIAQREALHQTLNTDIARKLLPDFSIIQVVERRNGLFYLDSAGDIWISASDAVMQTEILSATGVNAPLHVPVRLANMPKITQMAGDADRTLFLTADGKAWGSGAYTYGDLRLGVHAILPSCIPDLTNLVQVALGPHSAFFLTADGLVKACGSNEKGRLGLGANFGETQTSVLGFSKFENMVKKPSPITELPPIVCIVATDDSIWLLDEAGDVWQCGQSNKPEKITALKNIVSIIGKKKHDAAFFINKIGEVLAYGTNQRGELGFGDNSPYLMPQKVPGLIDIVSIYTFQYCTFYVNNKGCVFACGSNDSGELGLPDEGKLVKTPREIIGLEKIVQIETYFYDSSTLFLAASGNLFTCGKNYFCKKTDNDECLKKPTLIQDIPNTKLLFIQDGNINRIDTNGNLALTEYEKKSLQLTVISPFNFMVNYQLQLLASYDISAERLVELACSPKAEDQCFYDVLLNILGTVDRTTKLFYLLQLTNSTRPLHGLKAANLFLAPPQYLADLRGPEDLLKKQGKYFAVSKSLAQFFDYFVGNQEGNNEDQQNRRQDFITLLHKLSKDEIKRIRDLKVHLNGTQQQFIQGNASLFGLVSRPKFFQRYNNLRLELQNAVSTDAELLKYLQKAAEFFVQALEQETLSTPLVNELKKILFEIQNPVVTIAANNF